MRLPTLVRLVALATTAIVVALAVYSARPWGDNYAYQDLRGHVHLFVFVCLAVSPYLFIYRSSTWQPGYPKLVVLRCVTQLLLCVAGAYLIFDTVFVHVDAQGALVFLFLPIYQWIGLAVLEIILRMTATLVHRGTLHDGDVN